MPVRVSTPTNLTKKLVGLDQSGETYITLRPADFQAEQERGEALKNRTLVPMNGYWRTRTEVNLGDLWALEIWLAYVETNLVVEFTDEHGKVVKTVSFKPRSETNRGEFMASLGQLPGEMVAEMHQKVLEIMPDWAVPF